MNKHITSKVIILVFILILTMISPHARTAQAEKRPGNIDNVGLSSPIESWKLINSRELDFVASGSISGTVSCGGSLALLDHTVFVNIWMDEIVGGPDDSAQITCDDPYLLDELVNGTYYLSAWMDLNESGGGPPDPMEPEVWFDENEDGEPDPIVITSGVNEEINVLLIMFYLYLPVIQR